MSIKNLAAFYNLSPNPRTVAWFQVCTIAASIYAPRVFVITARKAKAKKDAELTQQLHMAQPQAPGVDGQGVYKFS